MIKLDFSKFSERAFSVAGPAICNSTPESIRVAGNMYTFKRQLKNRGVHNAGISMGPMGMGSIN